MSTNPFRQTRIQPDVPSAANQPFGASTLSDGSGSRPGEGNELSLDINVNNNFERHVSFASPPVDSTHPAASYPSSPESTRSPPSYFTRVGALATPDYRTAIQSDPFEDLARDKQEDGTLRQAVSNAQSNIAVSQPPGLPEPHQESAVWDTLSRFASAPSRPPVPDAPLNRPSISDSRKSLDVDAFKRLLLTGNTDTSNTQGQQSARRPAPPPPRASVQNYSTAQPAPETTFGLSSPGLSEESGLSAKKASFIDSLVQSGEDKTSGDATGKLPPPAPAPRRAKSVKNRDSSPLPSPLPTPTGDDSTNGPTLSQGKSSKRPPAPPIARRTSQRIPSNRSDDSIATTSPSASPAELARPSTKPPPPPPVRRQSSTTVRRTSQDLAPTIEEPEPEILPASGSRRSSTERPSVSGSRNPSISNQRPNPGLMSPPPLPPPRKGRGSSRSSMDGFRPSLATLMADNDNEQENVPSTEQSRLTNVKDRSSLTASNANSILAELANLQKEVDAARRN